MLRLWLLTVIAQVFFLAFFAVPMAQAADSVNLAVIDVQRIMRESIAAKRIQTQLDAKREAYQTEIAQEEKRLRAAEKKFTAERADLSTTESSDREQALKQDFDNVERQVQARRRALEQAFNNAMAEVRKHLLAAVEEIAKTQKLQAVIAKQQMLWNDNALDITAEVLTQLNQRLPDFTITIPAASNSDTLKQPE